jgi:hypothetical protein
MADGNEWPMANTEWLMARRNGRWQGGMADGKAEWPMANTEWPIADAESLMANSRCPMLDERASRLDPGELRGARAEARE